MVNTDSTAIVIVTVGPFFLGCLVKLVPLVGVSDPIPSILQVGLPRRAPATVKIELRY